MSESTSTSQPSAPPGWPRVIGANGGVQFDDGTTTLGTSSPDAVRYKPKRVASTWGTESRLAEDGVNIGSGAYDGSFGSGTVYLGCGSSGGSEYPAHFSQAISFPMQLTQAQLLAISAFDQ